MNGIALFSPLWLGFSSNFVAAGLLMELWEQTLRQPILRILCYYQPSNIHYQHSTENKKMYINKNISNDRNNSNFNVPFLRRSRRRADKWKLIVGKKNTARIIVTTKRVSREMNAREPAHPHPRPFLGRGRGRPRNLTRGNGTTLRLIDTGCSPMTAARIEVNGRCRFP